MSASPGELVIREKTKEILKFLENGQLEEARQVILSCKEVLHYNFGLINFIPLIPRIRFSKIIPKNNNALRMVIDTGYKIFLQEGNTNELLFFAAAKCDTETLHRCVAKITEADPKAINQIREGDTALMFALKFGNTASEHFPECVKILISAGVDVCKSDYFSRVPIVFLVKLYEKCVNNSRRDDKTIQNLKTCIELFLDAKTINLDDVKMDNEDQTVREFLRELKFLVPDSPARQNVEDERDRLFRLLIIGDQKSFIGSLPMLEMNADDGNNTLLQLCCEKNLKEAAEFLIRKGANLVKTTERNPKTPLEIAARRNNQEIFDALLKSNKLEIDENLFKTFLQLRPKHIKAKYFDEILKYKHLDMNIRSNNGNTPLHYAIIFSSREAIHALLKRGASLTVNNDNNKSALDYIAPEDLGNYFDKCIVPDNYNEINSGKYEILLNYRNLIDVEDTRIHSELAIIDKICNSPKTCHLISHPLIASFLNVKWKLVETLFQKLLIFHLILYLVSILSFININSLNYTGITLAAIYICKIYLTPFQWRSNKFHLAVEVTIAGILLISSLPSLNNNSKYRLGILATIFMAFSLHLFCRFSPKFAQFHAVLIKVLSLIFSHLSYVFVLSLFFTAASYIFLLLKQEDESAFDDFYLNIIFTNITELLPQFYLLCAFAVFFCVIILITLMNSLANLQERTEKIGDNFQFFGHKNILIFLKSLEEFYIARRIIKSPFVFEESHFKDRFTNSEEEITKKKAKKARKNINNFVINFYLNTNSFPFERLLSVKLDEVIIRKIKKSMQRCNLKLDET